MTTMRRVEGFLSPTQPIHTQLAKSVILIELREAVAAVLRRVHPRVYYEQAPEKTIFPYLVYTLRGFDRGDMELFVLDVDAWDVPEHNDTLQLEVLMDVVDRELHKRVGRTTCDVRYVIYRDRRFPVEDSDKNIRRRKGIYEIRSFRERSDYHGQ